MTTAVKVSEKDNRKHKEFEILQRRKEVASMYIRGMAQWEIARHFDVIQPTISNDLAAIRKGWLASAILDWDELKAKELAALDLQEEELWKAWFRSCGKERTKTASVDKEPKVVTKGEGKSKKVVGVEMGVSKESTKVVEKDLIGDPRFMEAIHKVRETRCKLLGFLEEKAPQVNVNIIDWETVSKPHVGDEIEDRIKALEIKGDSSDGPTETV